MSDEHAGAQQQPGADAGFSAVAAAQTLHEDLKVAHWILITSAREGHVRAVEAELLVASLYVTLHGDSEPIVPLFDLAQPPLMPAAHAVNVTVLAMAVAEQLGHPPADGRRLGLAALLKDIGAVEVPQEILHHAGPLGPAEQAVLRRHPIEGARRLIETEESLELPAVVAYEHHMGPGGSGYPSMRFPRPTHFASRLMHLLDVFCALSTRRPQRPAWEHDAVVAHIRERAGVEFDADLVPRVLGALDALLPHLVRLERPDQPMPWVRPTTPS